MIIYWITIAILIAIIIILLYYHILYKYTLKELINYSKNIVSDIYQPHLIKRLNNNLQELYRNLTLLAEKMESQKKISIQDNELLTHLLEKAVMGIILTKENGEIVFANGTIKNHLNVKIEGRNIRELFINRQFLDFVQQGINQDNVEIEISEKETIFSIIRFYLPVSQKFVYLFNDITDKRHLKRIKAEFISNLSHELRTPLTAIKGYLETMKDEDIKKEDKDRFFNIVCNNVDRLINIVSDLLVLSDVERPERKLYVEIFDLNKLAEEVITLFIQSAKEKGLYLRFLPVNIPLYSGDRFMMQQLLINLISNGIRFTEKGGVELAIRYEDKNFIISVSDTGIGISSDEIPKIFERFYTVDRARSRMLGGTGLGLSIVKHIVQLHHGVIDVESTPGKGSKFTIILPYLNEQFCKLENVG
ncbi:MAG: sensor histidine kinase [bacterium]